MALSWSAGQIITADELNARNPIRARMTGVFALAASSVVFQNVPGMVATLLPNRIYDVEMRLGAFGGNVTPDLKLDWAVTGDVALEVARSCWGPSINATDAQGVAAAAVTVGVVRTSTNFVLTSAVSYGVDATGAAGAITETFTVTTGAVGGTLQLRAAQNVANAAIITLSMGQFVAEPIS